MKNFVNKLVHKCPSTGCNGSGGEQASATFVPEAFKPWAYKMEDSENMLLCEICKGKEIEVEGRGKDQIYHCYIVRCSDGPALFFEGRKGSFFLSIEFCPFCGKLL